MSVEREMISDIIDCSMEDFVKLLRDVDLTTLLGIRNVLRNYYKQVELALEDLKERINAKNSYTEEEKTLFQEQSFIMFNIEEKARVITEEISRVAELRG